MSIDAIKKKLAELQSSNTRTNSLWKPSPGDSTVRILPYKYDSDLPFVELYFHYDINGKTYLSPISFGRPDPIEEFAQKLKTAGGSKEDWQLGKKIEAKMRTFAPIIVRSEENEGVKFWGFGKLVYQELLQTMADPDYRGLTDPVDGRDIKVTFQTAEELGANFPKTTVRARPVITPLTDNKVLAQKLLKEQKDIKEVYQELSYEDLEGVLDKYLSGDEGVTDEPETVISATEIDSEINSVGDATQAFEELFDDSDDE